MPSNPTLAVRAGWITLTRLIGAVVVGVAIGAGLHAAMPRVADWLRTGLAAVAALGAFAIGALLWGRAIAQLAGVADPNRIGRTTARVLAPGMIVLGVVLSSLEPIIVARGASMGLPVHAVYALLFVPATAIIAAVAAIILGTAMRDPSLTTRLVTRTAVSAATAFLIVDRLMDLGGWRVGAPDAGRRATMLVVTAIGACAAAIAGGASIGFVLSVARETQRTELTGRRGAAEYNAPSFRSPS
jgi:hypothetical protein